MNPYNLRSDYTYGCWRYYYSFESSLNCRMAFAWQMIGLHRVSRLKKNKDHCELSYGKLAAVLRPPKSCESRSKSGQRSCGNLTEPTEFLQTVIERQPCGSVMWNRLYISESNSRSIIVYSRTCLQCLL